ncbi:cell cycle checkpoint protein rad17 [Zygosaccharomyces mellis]|uniref:DNA damage checkpoint control protein RAD17 n=1 Tax=Zygosaccharomyces mellis TaxID=42258 RepID=A0A4C2EDC9_9SACH|nr:cell cycle checkpoint protein rad17 [Zygosaccharomyces mellis]
MRINDGRATHFSASTFQLDHITTALNCLTPFDNKQDVLIFIDDDGLSFARECNHTIRIQLFLSRDLFASYFYRNELGEQSTLCVNMNYLLNSFNIAHKNTEDALESTISYNGPGTPLQLIFEDPLITESVEYHTYHVSSFDSMGLKLDRDQVLFECIIKGDVLYSAIKDLKEIGCRGCCIFAKLDEDRENTFALLSKSQLGFSRIKLPSSRSILEKLEVYDGDSTTLVYDKPVLGFFDFNSFDKIRQSTKVASKVLLRMDVHGLLSVNILSRTDDMILTDTRSNSNNNTNSNSNGSSSGGSNNNESHHKQLSGEYPGIVIEVCMLEKENIDEADQEEFQLLMEINELERTSRFSKKSTYRRKQKVPNDDGNIGGTSTNNLLGLTSEKAEPVALQRDDDASPHSNNEIPLFF